MNYRHLSATADTWELEKNLRSGKSFALKRTNTFTIIAPTFVREQLTKKSGLNMSVSREINEPHKETIKKKLHKKTNRTNVIAAN